jgi:transcriptional regulator with XRE-family HTH domain
LTVDHWGTRLQLALRRRNVRKLHALAVEIGVDQSAISRWRNGSPISLPNAVLLCHALDVSLDWLLTGRGLMEAHRLAATAPIDFAAGVIFGNLSRREAEAIRQALLMLSEAAARRASPLDV